MEPFRLRTKQNFAVCKFIAQLILFIIAEIILFLLTHRNPTSNIIQPGYNEDHGTLEFVQVVFRHGERTPMDIAGPYPNDPYLNYTYEPYGPGALTDKGKRTVFELGKFLRKYYNDFLGEYKRDILYAKSSAMPRCRMSLLLVLAGLFPPPKDTSLESDLNWQPIPYDYTRWDLDNTFLYFVHCKKYLELLKEEQVTAFENEVENFEQFSRELEMYTGTKYENYRDLFTFYAYLEGQKEFGLKLPDWTNQFLPKPLEDFEGLCYHLSTKTDDLKRLSGGFILREIIEALLSKVKNPKFSNRKIHLYSGHDLTVANLMGTLGFDVREQIPYGSFFSLELHKIYNQYGLKVLLYKNSNKPPQILKLKDCQNICPLDKFIKLYSKYIATDDMCKTDKDIKRVVDSIESNA